MTDPINPMYLQSSVPLMWQDPGYGNMFTGSSGLLGSGSILPAISAPTTPQALSQQMYSGSVNTAGFMPGSTSVPGTPPGGSWLDTMNGAWSKYGDMIQGIGGILQSGMGIYGMLQNIRLAKKSFEHQRKGDILSYNMMVQNQRNYLEDREDVNAGAARARGRRVASEEERQAEVDRKSVAMWS